MLVVALAKEAQPLVVALAKHVSLEGAAVTAKRFCCDFSGKPGLLLPLQKKHVFAIAKEGDSSNSKAQKKTACPLKAQQ